MLPEVIRVLITSFHGEDGSSEVCTTVTFLTGGQKSAEKFRSCHDAEEGYVDPVMDNQTPQEKPNNSSMLIVVLELSHN